MENSDESGQLRVLPQTEALRQWNETDTSGNTSKSQQNVITIEPLPSGVNGEVPKVVSANGEMSDTSDSPDPSAGNTSGPAVNGLSVTQPAAANPIQVAVTIEPTPPPSRPNESSSGQSSHSATTDKTSAATEGDTQVSVEGGGQHTVVIKIEPGLEEESGTSDTQTGTSDTRKEQSGLEKESATSDTQKEQSQVSLGVIKTEKDTSEYERAAAGNSDKQATRAADGTPAVGGAAPEPSANAGPPQPEREYQPGSKTCNICNRVLSTPEACLLHIGNHYKEDFRMFECSVCKWAFESQMQYNVHMKRHKGPNAGPKPANPQETLKVSFPFQKGPSGGNKDTEKEKEGGGGKTASLTCLFCGRVLNTREALKTHQNNHCDQSFQFIECQDCGQCYENHALFAKHRKEDHKDNAMAPTPGGRPQDAYITYPCKICQRSFKTEGKMEEHVANHSKPGIKLHQCGECGQCFETSKDLTIHRRNKHKEKFLESGPGKYCIPCIECGRMFKNNEDMEKHLENHYNGTKLYTCSECGFAYEKSGTMFAHKYEKHVKPFSDKTPKGKKEKADDPDVIRRSCPVCKRIFKEEAQKEAHVINHNNNLDMIKCDSCSWQFEYQEAYAEHMVTGHKKGSGAGLQSCDTCGRKFKNESKRIAHIQNHMNDVTMYKCDFCPYEFEDQEECTQHQNKCPKAKEGTGKHACEFCERRFQSETIKVMHMQKHLSNEPMHKCAECGWQFEQVHQLTFHLKTHKGDKKTPSKKTPKKSQQSEKPNTVCDQCERQFYYESQMKTHLANHFNGSVLHKCLYCPWMYEKEASLPRHVEQYHPYYAPGNEFSKTKQERGQRFLCPLCGRIFNAKLQYIQHLANHTELPFACPYEKCGWAYADFRQFQTHKQQKHDETKENVKYRLEKMAAEGDETGDKAAFEETLNALNDPSAMLAKSVSFVLVCPRCKVTCASKREHHSHTMKCKTSYTCGSCKLLFDTFQEFELHLIKDEMECEVCKKMFPSECVIQTHLVSEHFSAEMLDESAKQQSVIEEEEKKTAAETKAKEEEESAAEVKITPKAVTSPKATKTTKGAATPKTPAHTATKAETPKSKPTKAETPKSKPTKAETPKSKPTPTRASTRSRATPTHTVTRASVESEDDDNDNAADENLVSSTVDMSDASTIEEKPVVTKRKRIPSTDSNKVDSSDDPTSKRRKFSGNSEDGNCSKKYESLEEESKKVTCDVVQCNGTFFDEHIYIEHVRHIHSDHINILSDPKCTVIEIKDASRVRPTQKGPASKRKVFTLLRVQCQQEKCKEENGSYFRTRAEYNKHVADIHSGKPSVKKDNEMEETKEHVQGPGRRRSKETKNASINMSNGSDRKLRRGRNDESLVQITVSSPDSDGPASGSASEEEDEPPTKRDKPEKERLKSMMSEASFTTLLKDLDSHKKGTNKTSTPIKPTSGKTSGAKVSTRRESSPARVSPRRKEVKKGNECQTCRKNFSASVSKCLCAEVDVHHSEARVKLRALTTKVVSQV